MRAVSYVAGDAKALRDLVNVDEAHHAACCDMLTHLDLDQSYYARTVFVGEHPIACFGVIPIRGAVASVWSLLSAESLRYPALLFRACREELDRFEHENEIRRFVSVARVDERYPVVERWHRALGFHRETMEPGMEEFDGEGGFYHQFARVKRHLDG